jgi:hypothetical protein
MARNIFGLCPVVIDPRDSSYIFGSVYFAKSMSEFALIESFIIYQVIKDLG